MKRGFAASAVVVILSGNAIAQVDVGAFSQVVRAIANQGLFPSNAKDPLQPSGFPGLDPKRPVDPSAADERNFHLLHADEYGTTGNLVRLDGDVLFTSRGYRVQADHADGDLRTLIFNLTGKVRIDGEDLGVQGERVIIDFRNRTYRSYNAESQIGPRVIQGRLKDKVYVKGGESFGSEREITTRDADLTTCNYPNPHYNIEAGSAVVRPGIRAILRKVRVKLFGKTIVQLPFLSVPLDDRTYQYLPEVGQSRDEGYYIKNRYGIPLKGTLNNLDTREDYMSKLGTGLGTDYQYASSSLRGVARVYKIFGSVDTFNFSNTHRQLFRWGSFQLDNDYQRDNYLTAPGSTLLNTRASLLLPQGNRTLDSLTFTRNSSEASGYNSTNQTIALNDRRQFNERLQTNLDLNYLSTSSRFTGSSTDSVREQLGVRFRGQDDLGRATGILEYQRTVPIGETTGFIGGSDRTPVLTLQSDARRLFGPDFGKTLPFRTELSWGQFSDPRQSSQISRSTFDFNFNRFDASPSRSKLDLTGDFRQSLYSDDTAQYVLNLGTNYRYRLGRDTGLNLRYSYLRPYGYSPLSIDQTGRTNFVSADLNVRPIRTLLLGAQTGYDIQRLQTSNIPWQQVGLRSEYQPVRYFLARGLYTYDTFQQAWSSLRFDFTYLPGATLLTLGTRFDGVRHTWSNVNMFLDGLKIGRTKVSAALAYNGYLKSFESKQFAFTYDLHDAEAILSIEENNTGFRPGRTISFFLRLKALPFNVPFGVGTRGQPIGLGTGRDF